MKTTDILIIDDDKNIGQLIELYLEKEGLTTAVAYRGDEGLALFEELHPALVLLDVMLPGMDAWEVLKQIRRTSNTPIIMLTAKGETFDKVLGLELGADDYMVKPFDAKELVARVKAVLRRARASEEPEREISFPGLSINMKSYQVVVDGTTHELPPKEIELLFFLAGHAGRVFTREQLLEQVWGFDYFGDSRTVDVHIKRLREKLWHEDASWQIKTVWGVGYKFEVK